MPTLLVVDDEPSILHAIGRVFRNHDFDLLTASTGTEAVEIVTEHRPDVVILDLNLPDLTGLEVFGQIHEFDEAILVIFITGHGTTDTAIEAVKQGAYDYLYKPLELDQLRHVVGRAFEIRRLIQGASDPEVAESERTGSDMLVGRCEAMQVVYKHIGQVAAQDVTVLITGESGTGKELVAQAIWKHSRRCNDPILTMNCAAIPETLLESELFGHEKGAFTGADQMKIGKFEQCSGGTLFLDEIGDMTSLTQAKVLRVLQDQAFQRVGSNETIQTDVRIIAATNRDLQQLVEAGEFREDLYYRLSVFTIHLPPLRDRIDDLSLLVRYFLRRFNSELGKHVQEVPDETFDLLRSHPWRGNVRELEGLLQQSLLRATGPALLPDFLPAHMRNQEVQQGVPGEHAGEQSRLPDFDRFVAERLQSGSSNLFAEATDLVERQLLSQVLQFTNGNQTQAARILGITRNTLRSRIRVFGL